MSFKCLPAPVKFTFARKDCERERERERERGRERGEEIGLWKKEIIVLISLKFVKNSFIKSNSFSATHLVLYCSYQKVSFV